MPTRLRGSEQYRVSLSPDDEIAALQVVQLLDVGQYPSDDLSEALQGFVENATNYLGYRGEVIYEIAHTPGGRRKPAGIRLLALPPGRVIRMPWAYYQMIPKADRQQVGKGWAIRIPQRKVWRITLPRHLGGIWRHRRMLKVLRERSSPHPSFVLRGMDLGKGAGYDLGVHDKACAIGAERATRRWGTMPSFFRVKGTTEYFSFARRLAWKRSQAELRDHVIAEFNSFLGRLGFTSRILVEGLTAPTEIGDMMRRLQAGEVTVTEAMAVDKG